MALQGDGKIVAVGQRRRLRLARLRARPLQPQRLARPELLRRRQADDRLRGRPTRRTGWRSRATARSSRWAPAGAPALRNDFALARYNPNGSLDTSFSGDGKQTTDFGGDDAASGVALQADGKIVAVGARRRRSASDFALARYNPNGSLDPSFSGDGKQTNRLRGLRPGDRGGAPGRRQDRRRGRILTTPVAVTSRLARYNPNGSLDPSFSGRRQADDDRLRGLLDRANGVALQGDGKIVAVGVTEIPGHAGDSDFALARYNPNGSLDHELLRRRQADDRFVGGDFVEATAVALQGDGKIVVVGIKSSRLRCHPLQPRRLARPELLRRRQADDRLPGGDFFNVGASGVALQSNGKIVVVGRGGPGFALARYNPNGSLDPSFSGDGKQTTDFAGEDFDVGASGVALQENGKIVAVGRCGGTGFVDFALARYNPNGSLDPSFSGDGKQRTDFGGGDAASGVALQGDGKIVAAGVTSSGSGSDFALARYNPNGTLDASFSGDGKQTTDFGGTDRAAGVALQADGKIVAAGVGDGTDGTSDFALARYQGG